MTNRLRRENYFLKIAAVFVKKSECSKESEFGPYLEPDESSPRPQTVLL